MKESKDVTMVDKEPLKRDVKAAMVLLQKLQEKRDELAGLVDGNGSGRTEPWIETCWCMELAIVHENITNIEQQIFNLEFNY